ncbi:MAG: DUF4886 domain-containing protein [Oscillospiraceae bacterium]|nr:DUF4886 domain-containing protein [Oscillospiraceae bacterium]
MKIISIGNSFSQDAHRYLHDIDEKVKSVNLHIGGCDLVTHWDNVENDNKYYDYNLNGKSIGPASVKEGLLGDDWDYVTLQQVSHDSGRPDTYYPYIELLSAYVKEHCPDATQIIHQTWAYDPDVIHDGFAKYGRDQQVMYDALKSAYKSAAAKLNVGIIPCGEVIQTLRENGFPFSLCRDGFHLSLDYGRYAAAATFYEMLAGNILETDFMPDDTDPNLINLIKNTVHEICGEYKK